VAPLVPISYPLNPPVFLRKRRAIRGLLAEAATGYQPVRIAVLGGSTTSEVVASLEVLLLNRGVRPSFYESDYNRYYEMATVDSDALIDFAPDVIYVCTSWRNIVSFPPFLASERQVEACFDREMARFREVWSALRVKLPACTILQNNCDPCASRPLGNLEGAEDYAASSFIHRLNMAFAAEARKRPHLQIVDAHGAAERLGTLRWSSPRHWFCYKMAQSPEAALYLANAVAVLVGALYGKSRKCLVLDLDNTLWGGVIGDDGVEGLKVGSETALAEAHSVFQAYCKRLRERGILLAVASKNDDVVARLGFSHPSSVLQLSDFSAFRANWDPKDANIREIARELNIGLDSMVFVDDNPAERALVRAQLPAVAVLEVGADVSAFPAIIEESGYFEAAAFSAADVSRAQQYAENQLRSESQTAFQNYGEYLASLQMEGEIREFSPVYLDRIAQLTNKTNQFNLTTQRYTRAQIETFAARPDCVTVYGRLIDRFGDNGLVSVVLGIVTGDTLEIDLWLMSCRVLKRELELAMLDRLVEGARSKGVTILLGRYFRTPKNGIVADHYEKLGFSFVSGEPDGSSSTWKLEIGDGQYQPRNRYIRLN
jgi:FkbH-like protein